MYYYHSDISVIFLEEMISLIIKLAESGHLLYSLINTIRIFTHGFLGFWGFGVLGYLRNGALDRKTFLVKVGSYEVYKTHIEFGEVW